MRIFDGVDVGEETNCFVLSRCEDYKHFLAKLWSIKMGWCPFCHPDEGENADRHIEEDRWTWWYLDENPFANPGAELHLLLYPKQHARNLTELPPEAQHEFLAILAWAENAYKLTKRGGGYVARFGDLRRNAGTEEHFHINIILPVQYPEKEVGMPLAKTEERVAANLYRLWKLLLEFREEHPELVQ